MSNENNEINVTEQPKHHKKKKRKHIEIRLDIKTNIMLIVITVLLIIIGTIWSINSKMHQGIAMLQAEKALPAVTNVWSGIFNVTMYTNHYTECSKKKGHKYFGITFSGRKAKPYKTVAVDPNIIPLGSVLINEMGQIYIAEDTGNAVKGHIVDLYIGEGTPENRRISDKWGKRQMWFAVIEHKGGEVRKNSYYIKE